MVDTIGSTGPVTALQTKDTADQNAALDQYVKDASYIQNQLNAANPSLLSTDQNRVITQQLNVISNPNTSMAEKAQALSASGLSLIWAIAAVFQTTYDQQDSIVDGYEQDMVITEDKQAALSMTTTYANILKNGDAITTDQFELAVITTFNDEGLNSLSDTLGNLDPPTDLGSVINDITSGTPLSDDVQAALDSEFGAALTEAQTTAPDDYAILTAGMSITKPAVNGGNASSATNTGVDPTNVNPSNIVSFTDPTSDDVGNMTSNWSLGYEDKTTEFSGEFTQTESASLTEASTMLGTITSTFANALSSIYDATQSDTSNIS